MRAAVELVNVLAPRSRARNRVEVQHAIVCDKCLRQRHSIDTLPDAAVGLKLNENGNVRINYNQSHFNIHSLPPDEFPALPKVKDGKSFSVDAETFINMIKQTIFAVSGSEEKYVLTGVLLEIGRGGSEPSNLRLVATDGYRLAKRGEKVDAAGVGEVSAIIPAKALMELARILEGKGAGKIKISVSAEQIGFQCDDVHLVSRLIQGQFPDYRQVIPKKSTTKITLPTRGFLEAAERAAVVASGAANVTRLEVRGGLLHLSANTPDVGSVDEVLEAEIKGGEKVAVSFNIRLITDVLKAVAADKVTIELAEALSPGILRPADGGSDYLYIVMPIRTQEAS